jgi:hypothetical protein
MHDMMRRRETKGGAVNAVCAGARVVAYNRDNGAEAGGGVAF